MFSLAWITHPQPPNCNQAEKQVKNRLQQCREGLTISMETEGTTSLSQSRINELQRKRDFFIK